MNLSEITPLVLTFNEAPNIRETLSRLTWAKRIVIVDSFSSDSTIEIASEFPNVSIHDRKFDHFAEQCNYGLSLIETPWVLSLDADYKCPESLGSELSQLDGQVNGYRVRFKYCIYGKRLRATLYPSRVVLYRKDSAKYLRDGHAHKVTVTGSIGDLSSVIDHDDWKSLSTWCAAQVRYADAEAEKLITMPTSELGWKDKIRGWYFLAPILTLFYCLIVKLLIFDGWRGVYYSLQRVFAELVLSLKLIDKKLRKEFEE